MSTDPILFEQDGAIARLILNRPDQGNAINLPLARRLVDLAIRCDNDPTIRCVVLTGAGRLFCAGGDLVELGGAGSDAPRHVGELAGTLHLAMSHLLRMAKPLLVLVNGPAAGAGLSLAISGDIVLGARSAHYTTAYGAVGISPDGGMSWLLPRLVGLRKAQDLILTNRRVLPDEAERIGLVTRTVEDEALASEGAATAQTLCGSAIRAIGASRALLAEAYGNGLETQLEKEVRSISRAVAGPEFREGVSAILNKRKPDFEGAGS
jgi:2-(1,2-epoxy-1,2-dihydrophenyl)acetyl-CoA isomerase